MMMIPLSTNFGESRHEDEEGQVVVVVPSGEDAG
jgi:hypothetical protein